MYYVDPWELEDSVKSVETQALLQSKLHVYSEFEKAAESYVLRDDTLFRKLFNISEIFETNIKSLDFLLNLISKLNNASSTVFYELFEKMLSIDRKSYNNFSNLYYNLQQYLENQIQIARPAQYEESVNVTEWIRPVLQYRDVLKIDSAPELSHDARQFIIKLLATRKTFIRQVRFLDFFAYKRNQYLLRIWLNNNTLKDNIAKIREEIRLLYKTHVSDIAQKEHIIAKKKQARIDAGVSHLPKFVEMQHDFEKVNLKMVYDHNRIIGTLENILEETANACDALHKSVQESQGPLLQRCYKREMNLYSWLQRYDADIVPRVITNNDLIPEVKIVVEKYRLVSEMVEEQLVEYDELMVSKSFIRLNDEFYEFMCNRSAQVVQAWWREYGMKKYLLQQRLLQIRLEKEAALLKSKKGKKKKHRS